MKFCEKLKEMRKNAGLTQDELAQKLYVTRTAVSKWETDKGLPGIDSIKMIAALFGTSIDALVSDDVIDTTRRLDERRSRIMYTVAVLFLAAATLFSVLALVLQSPYLNIGGAVAASGYVIFALLSKPRYKKPGIKKFVLPYVISRAVVLLFVVGFIVAALLQAV